MNGSVRISEGLTAEQHHWYENMKVGASFRAPYFRRAIQRLSASSYPGLGTFAVGRNGVVYIDFEWAKEGGMEKSSAMLIHVVSHLALDHLRRVSAITGDPNHMRTALVAEDMEINQGLVNRPHGRTHINWARSILKDEYAAVYPWSEGFDLEPDRPMEAYLRSLLRAGPKQMDMEPGTSTEACNLPSGMGGVLASPIQKGQGDSGRADRGDVGPLTLCGGGSGSGNPIADELVGNGQGLDPSELENLRRDVARDILEHEKANGRSSVPGQLVRTAGEILSGNRIDWRREIRAAVAHSVRVTRGQTRYNTKKHNRRMANASKFIFPGLESPTPNIAIAVDTSGSMGKQELGLALGQIQSILRQAGSKSRFDFVAVDAQSTEPRHLRKLSDVQLVGGGGTDMGVAITSFAERRANRPDLGIIVTDGLTPWPKEKPPGMAIVIAIVGQGSNEDEYRRNGGWKTPDWAKTVYVSRLA